MVHDFGQAHKLYEGVKLVSERSYLSRFKAEINHAIQAAIRKICQSSTQFVYIVGKLQVDLFFNVFYIFASRFRTRIYINIISYA